MLPVSPFGKGPVSAESLSPVGQQGGTPRAGGGTPVLTGVSGMGWQGMGGCSHTGAVSTQAQPKECQGEPRVGFRVGSRTGIRQCQDGVQLGAVGCCIPPVPAPISHCTGRARYAPPEAFWCLSRGSQPPFPPLPPFPHPSFPGPVWSCRGKFAEEHKHFLPCPHGH